MSASRRGVAAVAIGVALAAGCDASRSDAAAQQAPSATLALVGGTIYVAPDTAPIPNGVILIRDGRIVARGPRGAVTVPAGARVVDCAGTTVTAGFWNSHVHFTAPHWAAAASAPADTLARHLRAMLLRYGFVRVMDAGSPPSTLALRRRIDRGEVAGPAILTAGSGLAPKDASPFYIRPIRLPEAGTPAEATAVVREQLDRGVDAIKLFTGSYAEPTRIVPMPVEVVRAATTEAHARRKVVLAHPSNTAGLMAAIEGGVDILAHTAPQGAPWDAALVAQMKRAGIGLIPTLKLWKVEGARGRRDSGAVARFAGVGIEQLRAFAAAGGDVLFGTDVGYTTDYDPTDEYVLMQRAGMAFPQILAALTTVPSRRFRDGARGAGRLDVGSEADIVVLDGDPARDIRALTRVRHAFLHGRSAYARE